MFRPKGQICLCSRRRNWAIAAALCDWKSLCHLGRANTGATDWLSLLPFKSYLLEIFSPTALYTDSAKKKCPCIFSISLHQPFFLLSLNSEWKNPKSYSFISFETPTTEGIVSHCEPIAKTAVHFHPCILPCTYWHQQLPISFLAIPIYETSQDSVNHIISLIWWKSLHFPPPPLLFLRSN